MTGSGEGFRLAGYGVVRVCGTPVSVLARLGSGKVADLADELAQADQDWARLAPEVAEELTAVVPRLEDREHRRAVLAVRRTLHRGGPLTEDELRRVAGWPAVAGASGLPRLAALAAARTDLLARLETGYDEAWSGEQQVLAEAAAQPGLRSAAQLTSDGLLHNLDRYVADVARGDARGKRARTTEATLVNLVTRSALKPSPFGRLAYTRPLSFAAAPAEERADEPETVARQSVCRLPRQLVNWVERTLAGHEELRPVTVLRRAPFAAASAKGVAFVVRGRDGTDTAALVERIARAQPSPVLSALLELPADEPIDERQLLARCAGQPDAAEVLAGLVEQGVLARDLGIGEQEPDPLNRMARLLPEGGDERLRACVRTLAGVEAEFGTADTGRRTELLDGVRAAVTGLAEACGVPLPPLGAARTLVYEDSVVTTVQREPAERWAPHLPALATMHRLVPLFDDDAHVRAVVAQVVQEAFGPGPHRLLTLYSLMSGPKLRALLTARLVDVAAGAPSELRRVQDAVLRQPDPGAGPEFRLDHERLAEAGAGAPRWVSRWPRVHWQVQRHGERLVVNSCAAGYGRAISRFCSAYAGADRPAAGFTELVRADIARDDDPAAPLTDLSAVLGINANVHPPLLGQHLRYPCGTPQDWGGAGVSLEDCWAEVDGASGKLVLRNGKTGPPLRLVTLNFLLNDLAPQLYRFLNFFGLGSLANLAWWDRADQRFGGRDGIRVYPRVRLDEVVLARRTWKIPAAELPDLTDLDGAAAFRAVRSWRRSLDLPEQVFWRKYTVPDPLVAVSPEERARLTRSLTQFPSSAERKPAFLDFGSVTGVRTWQRALRHVPDELTLQECLPEPGSETTAAGQSPTREFTIETAGGDR
jgi:lantibiotic biosynthesis dehydratase-like protein